MGSNWLKWRKNRLEIWWDHPLGLIFPFASRFCGLLWFFALLHIELFPLGEVHVGRVFKQVQDVWFTFRSLITLLSAVKFSFLGYRITFLRMNFRILLSSRLSGVGSFFSSRFITRLPRTRISPCSSRVGGVSLSSPFGLIFDFYLFQNHNLNQNLQTNKLLLSL